MLKVTASYEKVKHLIRKRPGIIVTNACNLSCGGCYAQCGKFDKEKVWFISLDQFLDNLEYIAAHMYQGSVTLRNGEATEVNPHGHGIDMIGGEPTIHPEWGKIWELITTKYRNLQFLISTNGRIEFPPADNVGYHLVYKTKDIGTGFVPTLVAPADIVGNPDRKYYWEAAQTDCGIWKNRGCVNPIYKNRISFCSVAASWDDLLDLGLTWPLTPGANPFAQLTDLDVEEKAKKVCYRCGWAKKLALPELQRSESYDLVSQTNLEVLTKNARNKPYKLIYKEGDVVKASEVRSFQKPQDFVPLTVNKRMVLM